tara:strand:- start:7497 stop:9980 length:2484 start_codon:yes stop_codon:yes gene_type:complete
MPIARYHQADFATGEIDPKFISRTDVEKYRSSLQKARNVLLRTQGGFERRPGTLFRADLGAASRLEPFIFSEDQEYVFAFQHQALKIYSTAGVLLQTITSQPWTSSNYNELNFTQQGDTMIVVHSTFNPKVIKRTGATTFTSTDFAFDSSVNGKRIYQPYFKFADDTVTLDCNSDTAGTGKTITASASYFTSDYVGTTLKIYGTEATVTGYTSATQVTVTLKDDLEVELDEDPLATQSGSGVIKVTHVAHGLSTGASVTISGAEDMLNTEDPPVGLTAGNINGSKSITVVDDDHYEITASSSDTASSSEDGGGVRIVIKTHAPTRDWQEQVLSTVNGFPKAIAFHEQRLFLGGVTNLPDLIAGSKVGQFFNFDIGDAEDSDSIQIQIASDEINEIRHILSGQRLEILTNTAEWYLRPSVGKPITPVDIAIVKQSNLGSQLSGITRKFDGGTLFVQTNGKVVRSYEWDGGTEQYTATPISLLSSHLIQNPTDSDRIKALSESDQQLALFTSTDGSLAIYSAHKLENLKGWVKWTTDGTFASVCCTTNSIYSAVTRTINSATVYYLEQFADTAFDLPTDMTVTKTVSGSYQPHGSPLTNGAVSSSSTLIIDGCTQAPQTGETFQFAGTGTVYTIQSSTATGNSNEYAISISGAVSQSDGVALQFVTSRTFTGLNSTPDMRAKTVYATSGSTEGGNIKYYGSATVDSNGVAVFDIPASAIDIGLDYDVEVQTLPPIVLSQPAAGQAGLISYPRKIAKAILELSSTYNIKVNTNDVIVQTTSQLDTSTTMNSYTGKKEIHLLGYNTEPTLTITQGIPTPMRVIGITQEVYY